MTTQNDIMNIRNNNYNIHELLRSESIVPFIGAGMSADIYPLWKDFLEQFSILPNERESLNRLIEEGKYEEAASFLFSISRGVFIDHVKNVFSPTKINEKSFSQSLLILPQIFYQMVLTTNIDEVIENVWNYNNCQFDSIITPDCEDQFNDAIINGKNILIKLHGTVRESSKYVLTKEQYDKYYGVDSSDQVDLNKPFPRDLGRALQSKTILFLGCSLKNDRVLHVMKQIAKWNEYIKHYAILSLSENENENILRERELREYGIIPIWFPNKQYGYIYEILSLIKKNHIT